MLPAPLLVYLFILLGTLVVGSSGVMSFGEFIAIGVIGFIGLTVIKAWSSLIAGTSEDADDDEDVDESMIPVGMHVPAQVLSYLQEHHALYNWYAHRDAHTALELASTLHISGDGVAVPVLVRADDTVWMAVLPATEHIDLSALRSVLHVKSVELVHDEELPALFPGYEVGAEPPLGRLFHIPTIVESDLIASPYISFWGGRHDESLEMSRDEYLRVERPLLAHFGHRTFPMDLTH
jgi:Ala-tRNA(Pro) deacylase